MIFNLTSGLGVLQPGAIGAGGAPIPLPALALYLSSVLQTGVTTYSKMLVNGGDGTAVTSNVPGLTIDNATGTATWDGSGSAGTYANGLVQGGKSTPVVVMPADVGPLRLSNKMFFVGEESVAGIIPLGNYTSSSVITLTCDDGTMMSVSPDSQGYPFADFILTTPGMKTVTIPDYGSGASTFYIMALVRPAAPTVALAKVTAAKWRASRDTRQEIVVAATPPTITYNTGNSLANGRSLAAGGSIATNAVPNGRGVAGNTNPSNGNPYVYAQTVTGVKAFTAGVSKRGRMNGSIFDCKIATGIATRAMQTQVIYTLNPDAPNPTFYKARLRPYARGSGVYYLTHEFPSAGVAFELLLGEGVSITGFNVAPGDAITPYVINKPSLMVFADSFAFSVGPANNTTGNIAYLTGDYLGTPNAETMGLPSNAFARIGGTAGTQPRAGDRVTGNPHGWSDAAWNGRRDGIFTHMSINDHTIGNYTSYTPSTRFASQGNYFVPGTTTYRRYLAEYHGRMRYVQTSAVHVVDAGFASPSDVPSAALIQIQRDAFAAVYDSDPLAIFADLFGGTYRWMGQTFTIPNFTAPIVAPGAQGSSPLFANLSFNGTASIAGDVLTVEAVSSGKLQVGMSLSGSKGPLIMAQLSGTPGGLGTYLLDYPPGDATSASIAYIGDNIHPADPGVEAWANAIAAANLFCCDKVLAL